MEIIEPPRLRLGSIEPLVEYLVELSRDCCDRQLTWFEDERACELLLNLSNLESAPYLRTKVLRYIDPECRPFRTLSTWYCIARTVAHLMRKG